MAFWRLTALMALACLTVVKPAFADEKLDGLIAEALKNNREVLMLGARQRAAGQRPSQLRSLPDPMLMVGYQNEGFDRYTYGEMADAQWMLSVSQMVPYPGKRPVAERMAQREAEGASALYRTARQRVTAEVKERYYDLYLIYKVIDLIEDKKALFKAVEEAASARYASGMAPQQEVLMAQTEKYMLAEKQEMLRQKKEAAEAMLNRALGRDIKTPIERPNEPDPSLPVPSYEEAMAVIEGNSPELDSKRKMAEAAELKRKMAGLEYFPDVTFSGTVAKRGGEFEDMWSLSAQVNLPIYRKRLRSAELEAEAGLGEAKEDFEDTRLMLASALRDNASMAESSARLMDLYSKGLIPKTKQGFDSAMAGYASGRVEITALIKTLTALLDYEIEYHTQLAGRLKAGARIAALSGTGIPSGGK